MFCCAFEWKTVFKFCETLFTQIVQVNGVEGEIELAFLNLDPVARRPPLAVAAWSPGDLSSAEEEARRVVRLMRAGVFWPPETPPRYEDGLVRLAGRRNARNIT